MSEELNYHMTAEEFRRHGYAVVDWIAGYYENIESLPVLSRVKPGQVRSTLPVHAPEVGEPFEDMLRYVFLVACSADAFDKVRISPRIQGSQHAVEISPYDLSKGRIVFRAR